jgi:MarR family transcriptional regulator, organic hydroperoxide resistance regulator
MSKYESLHLKNQLSFALYQASHAINAKIRPYLKNFGLTYPQYFVLCVLWESDTSQTVKAISDKLSLDSGTLTPLLKRMENAGFVVRKRSKKDERVVNISLTPASQAIQGELAEMHIEATAEVSSLAGFSVAKSAELIDTLYRLSETLEFTELERENEAEAHLSIVV